MREGIPPFSEKNMANTSEGAKRAWRTMRARRRRLTITAKKAWVTRRKQTDAEKWRLAGLKAWRTRRRNGN
jgi:hypothetical protein